MDYERIDKPHQGGGLSPGKLRSMLLGVEKRRKKDEEEVESAYTSGSQFSELHEPDGSRFDNFKDVDVVSVLPECSTSSAVDSVAACTMSDCRVKDQCYVNSRIRSQEVPSSDYDSGHDAGIVSTPIFEFQKGERGQQRVPLGPFSKPAPSKWDDAQKWIASPTSNRPKMGQAQGHGAQVVGSRKMGNAGYMTRQSSTKVVVEVPDQKVVAVEEPDTKWVDTDRTKMEKETGLQKFLGWEADSCPIADSYGKSVLMLENSVGKAAISLSQHDSSLAMHSTTFIPPPSTARSVSMRDMGTEMTPIASQEPSRTGTPVRATTPFRSPSNSRPSSPTKAEPASLLTSSPANHLDSNKDLSEKELQMKTRKEIMALGTQLGKMNIAAWASKEEEDKDASTSLKTVAADQPSKSVIETRAAAWEEAEKAKYTARHKHEEMKIQAWENHQKAKTESEMRKIEVEVERIRGMAQDRLMNKLAAARHKAEEKRAAAEAKRNRKAAKTEQQAEYIRRTGRIPSSFSCCGWCS